MNAERKEEWRRQKFIIIDDLKQWNCGWGYFVFIFVSFTISVACKSRATNKINENKKKNQKNVKRHKIDEKNGICFGSIFRW